MARWSFSTVLIISSLCIGVGLAQNGQHGVSFLFPIADLTVHYFDTVNVSYTSQFTSPLLYTFCTSYTDGSIITEHSQSVSPNNASALVLLNYNNGSPCWFDLRPNISAGYGANSPSFTLNPTQVSFPKTIGLSQTSTASSTRYPMTSSQTSPSSTTSALAATTTPSTTPLPATISDNASFSAAAKAGIGIAIALGALLVAAIAAHLIYRRKRRRNNGGATQLSPSVAQAQGQGWPGDERKSPTMVTAVHELPAGIERQELGTGWNAHEIGPGR